MTSVDVLNYANIGFSLFINNSLFVFFFERLFAVVKKLVLLNALLNV